MNSHIRLSISKEANGDVEIYSFHTETTLVLPAQDVQLLIDSLSRDKTSSPLETVSLDPSSETCESDKK